MSSDSGSSFDTSLSRISLGRKSFWDTQRGNKSVKLQFLVNLNCITIWFNLTLIFNLCLECNKGQYGLSQVKACPSQFLKGLFFFVCMYFLGWASQLACHHFCCLCCYSAASVLPDLFYVIKPPCLLKTLMATFFVLLFL